MMPKLLPLATLIALVGCQAKNVEELVPSATQKTIEQSQLELASYEQFEVTDNGVIIYTDTVEEGFAWINATVQRSSYNIACDSLRPFVDAGMIVRLEFKGRSGTVQNYDQNRCIERDAKEINE